MNKLAYAIDEVCDVSGTGKTAVYEEINTGKLRAVKRGRRTLVLTTDLQNWLEQLPAIASKPQPTEVRGRAKGSFRQPVPSFLLLRARRSPRKCGTGRDGSIHPSGLAD